MLAAQGEKPAEDGEAAQARGRFHEAAQRSVQGISLHDPRDPDCIPTAKATRRANRHGLVRPKPRSSKTSPAGPATWGRSSTAPVLGTAASRSAPDATAVPAKVKVTHHPASSARSSNAKTARAAIVTSPLRSASAVRRLITRSSAVGRTGSRRRSERTSASTPATKAICGANTIAANASRAGAGNVSDAGTPANDALTKATV